MQTAVVANGVLSITSEIVWAQCVCECPSDESLTIPPDGDAVLDMPEAILTWESVDRNQHRQKYKTQYNITDSNNEAYKTRLCHFFSQETEEKDLRTDCEVHWEGAYPLWPLSRRGLDPIKQAYDKPVCQQSRARRYAELAISSPAVAETIAGTHCTGPRRDGQAEWPVN